MKILAINGSHRGNKGVTSLLIQQLFLGAQSAGAECQEVILSQLKINRCLGCLQCHQPEHLLRCVWDDKDDVRSVFDLIEASDLVIYATPVYVFGMSGLMKTFLDRFNANGNSGQRAITQSGLFFHHILPAVCSKPFMSLICCDNVEDETPRNARDFFRTFARFMDAPQVGELLSKSSHLIYETIHEPAVRTNPVITQILQSYTTAGVELATSGRISRKTQACANQAIIHIPRWSMLLKYIPVPSLKKEFLRRAQGMKSDYSRD
jgi:NAD(P)H-dependent FMN reductase